MDSEWVAEQLKVLNDHWPGEADDPWVYEDPNESEEHKEAYGDAHEYDWVEFRRKGLCFTYDIVGDRFFYDGWDGPFHYVPTLKACIDDTRKAMRSAVESYSKLLGLKEPELDTR